MFRFTIRDLLWQTAFHCVVVIAAVAIEYDLQATDSIAEIQAGIETRQSKYRNFKITYSSQEQIKADKPDRLDPFGAPFPLGPQSWRNTLKIVRSDDAATSRPLRCWERFIRDSNGQWRPDRFLSFDGKKSVGFVGGPVIGYGKWNMGHIVPFEEPFRFQQDVFQSFLFLELTGPSLKVLHASDVNPEFDLRITGKRVSALGNVIHISGRRVSVNFNIEVTDNADFLVTLWKAMDSDGPFYRYEVKKIGNLDGVLYPASGSFQQWPRGERFDHRYDFTVEAFERLGDGAVKEWDPTWPLGTVVADHINNANFEVPHNK